MVEFDLSESFKNKYWISFNQNNIIEISQKNNDVIYFDFQWRYSEDLMRIFTRDNSSKIIFINEVVLINIDYNLTIENCNFRKSFFIKNIIKNNLQKIIFLSCLFEDKFNIYWNNKENKNEISYLEFSNCNFRNLFHNKYVNFSQIIIDDCLFEREFYFENNVINNYFSVRNSKFLSEIGFLNNDLLNGIWTITFSLCDINCILSIYNSNFKYLKLVDLRFLSNDNIEKNTWFSLPPYIKINSDKENWDILINKVDNLQNLHITWNIWNKLWKYKKIDIQNINFIDSDKNSYIINYLDIDNLKIKFCSNFSKKLIFQNLDIANLNICNSDLWKTTFNWVKIKKIYLENVTLNDCIFNWVDFPDNYILENIEYSDSGNNQIYSIKITFFWKIKNFLLEISEIIFPDLFKKFYSKKIDIEYKKENKINYKSMKDNYRQLKFVMEKNWNKTEANKFFEKEMDSYLKEVMVKNVFLTWKDYWNIDNYFLKWGLVWEKITLLFWKILNNFGNNWIITVIWLFTFISYSTFIKTEYKKIEEIWFINNFNNYIERVNILLYNLTLESFIWYVITFIIFIFLLKYIKTFIIKIPVIFITLLVIWLFIWTYYISWEKEIFNDFLKLLFNPFYWFKDLYSENMEWIELYFFTIYKITYIILFWHLIVALKRTTKR